MENCMEVVIDRDAFVKGLQMVQNIVEPRQTLPILANVLLEADGEAVRVTATDLEVGARVTIPAKVASKGAITVSARKLGEIVKELPAAAVALRVTDNASVSLRCAGATYKLVGLAPDDFPPVVPASPASWVSLEGKTLREMLAQTSFAISHDETRYALNGILFVLQGKDVQMVATDGHRLAVSKRSLGRGVGGMTGIVPRKAVIQSMRVFGASQDLGEAEEGLEVAYSGEELVIGFNSRYLLDAVAAVERDQIVLELKDSLSPGVIKSVEDEGYCCVIMPMRI